MFIETKQTKKPTNPGVVAHVFNPGIRKAEASVSDMKANLNYIENSETCLVYTEPHRNNNKTKPNLLIPVGPILKSRSNYGYCARWRGLLCSSVVSICLASALS